ncbi:TNT domain-containing protein [Streptomyces sp. NPDC056105]|uniref:TNT domain-containing protein n=1 Tax=Streptomyces sp. NPDC056105 TaxID=3345714 RepID=UPI0035D64FB5
MTSPRRGAGLAAATALLGSLFLGAPAAQAAPAATLADDSHRPHLAAPAATLAEDSIRPHVCRGLVPDPIPYPLRSYYFCNDWRLGPQKLPTRGLVAKTLHRYQRLGHLTATQFLNRWWDPTADTGQGDWRYPDADGYAKDPQGHPIAAVLTLHKDEYVDRFGNEAGRYLAPAGTKYGKRSIPPSSLNTADPRHPYNYYLYKVTKDVDVCAGPIAPAFEQPGLGVQYVTSSSYCPDIPRTSVLDLVRNGTLVRRATS